MLAGIDKKQKNAWFIALQVSLSNYFDFESKWSQIKNKPSYGVVYECWMHLRTNLSIIKHSS